MHRTRVPPCAPLPGTGAPARGLFLARSGVLFERAARDQARFDQERLSEALLPLLFRATQSGWTLYLVGNEEGVARGRISELQWERFELECLAVATAARSTQALIEPPDLLSRNAAGGRLAAVVLERAQLDVVGLVDRTMDNRRKIRGHGGIAHLILEERSIAKCALRDAGRRDVVLMAICIGVRKDCRWLDAVPRCEFAERANGLAIATEVAIA